VSDINGAAISETENHLIPKTKPAPVKIYFIDLFNYFLQFLGIPVCNFREFVLQLCPFLVFNKYSVMHWCALIAQSGQYLHIPRLLYLQNILCYKLVI